MTLHLGIGCGGAMLVALHLGLHPMEGERDRAKWTSAFPTAKQELISTGRNPYFVLDPGWVLELGDKSSCLTITVLPDTIEADGVWCKIVEEREAKGNQLETSRNYFAISTRTNSVYYFGEDAGGAWSSGVKGARFGLMMPGLPLLGVRYYEEIAPGVAMARAEIVGMEEKLKTPAGEFVGCLKIAETTRLDPLQREYKFYAPGVGLVQDGSLQLISYGRREPRR
ncbi:MAG: hypothetical protein ACUVWA_14225 [Candidatus Oleimicrobiaceae bacterium]